MSQTDDLFKMKNRMSKNNIKRVSKITHLKVNCFKVKKVWTTRSVQ